MNSSKKVPLTCGFVHAVPRFDWYAATLDTGVHPDEAVQLLQTAWGASAHLSPGRNGYSFGVRLRRNDLDLAMVYGGGQNAGVHVQASGEPADAMARTVRRIWPDHGVARADVAIDFDGGARGWEAASRVLRSVAIERNVQQLVYQDPDRIGEAGRTHYVGSPKAETRVRLYEKGLKDAPDTHRAWVRHETQVRPQNRLRKRLVALAGPSEIAGYANWAREALDRIFGVKAMALPPRPERVGDDQRALMAMASQYGQVMARAAANQWGAFGLELGNLVRRQYPNLDIRTERPLYGRQAVTMADIRRLTDRTEVRSATQESASL